MTSDEMRNAVAVMIASDKGEPIQLRMRSLASFRPWERCQDPCWNWEQFEYRIAPKPRVWWRAVPKEYDSFSISLDNPESESEHLQRELARASGLNLFKITEEQV